MRKIDLVGGVQMKTFVFPAMILKIFSRYCHQLILSEIFNIKYDKRQFFKYFLTKDEIIDLGKRDKSEIIFEKNLSVDYNFELSIFKKNYNGKIDINCKFIPQNTLENSYYVIEIELKNNEPLKINPFFLNEKGYKTLISEFIHKLWLPIQLELIKPTTIPIFKGLKELNTPYTEEDLKKIVLVDTNQDLIFDVFYIVFSHLYEARTTSNIVKISADNIIRTRGLIENANSKGCRSGYKNEQRHKIHAALNILNSSQLFNIDEITPFTYVISLGKNIKTANLTTFPLKLVSFNLKTQICERRIAFYILKEKKEKIKIKNLVNLIKNQTTSFKPNQIREKIEKILDFLCEEKILRYWHYTKINEDELIGKNWLEKWLTLTITCRY